MKRPTFYKHPGAAMAALLFLCLQVNITAAEAPRQNVPPLPAPVTSVGQLPRLGLDTGDVMDAPALDNAVASGAHLVRVSVRWSEVEPVNTDPTHYVWLQTDNIYRYLSSRGLIPITVILGCPLWACPDSIGPLSPGMEPEAAQFAAAMAARYSRAPYAAHVWEIWNEPDAASGPGNSLGWGMHPAGYAQMMAAVYPAIKAADPEAVVMLGGIAYDYFFSQGGPFNPDFLPDVLAANGGAYTDAVAFHYYRNNANGWTTIGLKANQLNRVLAGRGVTLPLICTESGLTSSPVYGSSETLQARYLVEMNVSAASAGVKSTVWYLNRDFQAREPGWEVFASSGLTRLDNTPKMSFTAMQVLSEEIGSGLFQRPLGTSDGLPSGVEGYLFSGAHVSHQIEVVWNNGTGTGIVTVPASQASNLLTAVDMLGAAVPIQRHTDGTATVNVSATPLYLDFQSARFLDVPLGSWMYNYVEYLAQNGYISGYADGTFRPGNPATRAQFSKMIVLGMGWPLNTSGGPHFADVPATHPFYSMVETAYSHGIISGYACGGPGEPCPGTYFRPNNNITRSQIAKLVVIAKGWPIQTPPNPSFADVTATSPFYAYVETAVAHAVAAGYSDGTFRPGNNATRAQLSKMLTVALQQP